MTKEEEEIKEQLDIVQSELEEIVKTLKKIVAIQEKYLHETKEKKR